MKRILVLAYSLFSYVVFLATFAYAVGFIGNIMVPKSIDSIPEAPLGLALFVNAALLVMFALQHSVMARPAFKRWWTKFVPEPAERSTYILFSSLALMLMFVLWEPVGGVVWSFTSVTGLVVGYGLYAAGWLLVLASSFAINHFDLFGLRQAWFFARGRDYEPVNFVQPWLYTVVRHPLYVGWLLVMWATPTMTATHLLFALGATLYMLGAIQLEERDLQTAHPEYGDYKRRVPMLIPNLLRWRRGGALERAQ